MVLPSSGRFAQDASRVGSLHTSAGAAANMVLFTQTEAQLCCCNKPTAADGPASVFQFSFCSRFLSRFEHTRSRPRRTLLPEPEFHVESNSSKSESISQTEKVATPNCPRSGHFQKIRHVLFTAKSSELCDRQIMKTGQNCNKGHGIWCQSVTCNTKS